MTILNDAYYTIVQNNYTIGITYRVKDTDNKEVTRFDDKICPSIAIMVCTLIAAIWR